MILVTEDYEGVMEAVKTQAVKTEAVKTAAFKIWRW